MSRFPLRSNQKELIDEEGIGFGEWAVCLKELNTINTFLGGHAITVDGVRQLMQVKPSPTIIAEIGCGGGDNLKAISRAFGSTAIKFIGIDINKACIAFAEKNCMSIPDKEFIESDYRLVDFGPEKPDIIFCSLFCHHFEDAELVQMMIWMKNNSRAGFFINDLQRHPLAYHSISILTQLFSKSYLVKNDAPISVRRGFKKSDWDTIMRRAGITKYTVKWRWAFRYLVLVKND